MKKLFFAFALAATLLGGAELTIGSPARELLDCAFIKGANVKIAGKNPTPTLLFFWSIGYASNQELGKIIAEAQGYGNQLRVVTIGCDDEAKLREFFMTKDIPFPVIADTKLTNVNTYLHEKDQVPFCVILDKSGVIAWRGPANKVSAPLKEIVTGKYNLAQAIRIDRFKRDLAAAMAKKDFQASLRLVDAELQNNPENLELIVFSVNLLDKGLGKPDVAQARLAESVRKYPRNVPLHEVYLRYLHLRHQKDAILAETDFIIRTFADNPTALRQTVGVEMSFPIGELSPVALLRLGKAIATAKNYKDDREHAMGLLLYAKILSFCNAPTVALKTAMQAKCLLRDAKDIEEVDRVIAHYQEILRLSRELQP